MLDFIHYVRGIPVQDYVNKGSTPEGAKEGIENILKIETLQNFLTNPHPFQLISRINRFGALLEVGCTRHERLGQDNNRCLRPCQCDTVQWMVTFY